MKMNEALKILRKELLDHGQLQHLNNKLIVAGGKRYKTPIMREALQVLLAYAEIAEIANADQTAKLMTYQRNISIEPGGELEREVEMKSKTRKTRVLGPT